MRNFFGNSRSAQRRKEEDEARAAAASVPPPEPSRADVSYAYLGDGVGLALTHRRHKILVFTKDFGISPHIIAHGLWEPNIERAILKLIEPGHTIVEVGANVGYHTLAMAHAAGRGGHVHAFEANPRLFTLLRWSVDLNGFLPRTTLYNLAATDRTGTVRFDYDPIAAGGGHIVPKGHGESPNAFTIACESLDRTLKDVANVDLLRMDAEGSEPIIVKGAAEIVRRSPSIRIVTEWSPIMMREHGNIADYLAFLKGLGFSAWQIDPHSEFVPVAFDQLENMQHCEIVFSRDNLNPPPPEAQSPAP